MALYLALIAIFLFVCLEIFLAYLYPSHLPKGSFDDFSVMESDHSLGWRPRPNSRFTFHHKYLNRKNYVAFNGLGTHDPVDYSTEKARDVFRIQLYGCTVTTNYETSAQETVASQLKKKLKKIWPERNIEVMNCSVKNYCTGQLFRWYAQELYKYNPDIIVYYMNVNHPRRNISIHESGLNKNFTQPVFSLDPGWELKMVLPPEIEHANDMVYLDESFRVKVFRGKEGSGLHAYLKNHLRLYILLCDLLQGRSMRRFKDRLEIKKIEREFMVDNPLKIEDLPYFWRLTARIIHEWKRLASKNGAKFILAYHLDYYNAGEGRLEGKKSKPHEFGFSFEENPVAKYLKLICEEFSIPYIDGFAYARDRKIDNSSFYIHPRYSYLTPKGCDFVSDFILDLIAANEIIQQSRFA